MSTNFPNINFDALAGVVASVEGRQPPAANEPTPNNKGNNDWLVKIMQEAEAERAGQGKPQPPATNNPALREGLVGGFENPQTTYTPPKIDPRAIEDMLKQHDLLKLIEGAAQQPEAQFQEPAPARGQKPAHPLASLPPDKVKVFQKAFAAMGMDVKDDGIPGPITQKAYDDVCKAAGVDGKKLIENLGKGGPDADKFQKYADAKIGEHKAAIVAKQEQQTDALLNSQAPYSNEHLRGGGGDPSKIPDVRSAATKAAAAGHGRG